MNEIVKAYDKEGENACSPNATGDTPLHLAALSGNTVAIDWLMDPLNCSIDPNYANKYVLKEESVKRKG